MTAAPWLTKCQSLEIPDVKEGIAAADDLDISAHACVQIIYYVTFEVLKVVMIQKPENIVTWAFQIRKTNFVWFLRIIGGSCRVTLVVAFGFLPQNFGRWQGTYEWYFVEFIWIFLHSLAVGTLKHHSLPRATLWNFRNI